MYWFVDHLLHLLRFFMPKANAAWLDHEVETRDAPMAALILSWVVVQPMQPLSVRMLSTKACSSGACTSVRLLQDVSPVCSIHACLCDLYHAIRTAAECATDMCARLPDHELSMYLRAQLSESPALRVSTLRTSFAFTQSSFLALTMSQSFAHNELYKANACSVVRCDRQLPVQKSQT